MFRTLVAPILLVFSLIGGTSSAFSADVRPFKGELSSVTGEGYSVTVNGEAFGLVALEKNFMLFEAEMTTQWGPEGVFVGPKLQDVLSQAGGCACAPLTMTAADDYAVTMPAWPDGVEDAIIVTRLNGEPLPLDEFGPFWLVWPSMNDAVVAGNEEHAAYWIWSLVAVTKAE